MSERSRVRERAVDAACLDQRILKNKGYQKVDLVEWIFNRVRLDSGDRVLELCSGTGNQTMRMIELVGDQGHVVAMDLSAQALDQLSNRAEPGGRKRLTTVAASMDDLSSALEASGLGNRRFGMFFCAYGLYYSDDPVQVLKEGCARLTDDGRIVVVGPFGPNNGQLFEVLERSGVNISDYVRYTSKDFMERVVLPFACRHFTRNTMHVLVNPVQWKSPEDVMQYWRHTTFFDEQKADTVEGNVKAHFQTHEAFINEKWIMLVEMADRISNERAIRAS